MSRTIENYLYGRENEISIMERHFEYVTCGESAACIVTGEAGVGKTYLLSNFAKKLNQKGAKYIYTKCERYNTSAFTILSDIIRQLINLIFIETDEILQNIKNKLKCETKVNLSLIGAICPEARQLLEINFSNIEQDYYKHEYMYHKAFYYFVSVVSKEINPIILHIDDVQWADETMTRIININHKFNRPLNVYLIFSLRNEEKYQSALSGLKPFMEKAKNIEILNLHRLSYESTTKYIKSRFIVPIDNEKHVLDRVYQATMGNPYYINRIFEEITANKDKYFLTDKDTWKIPDVFFKNIGFSDDIMESVINQVYQSNDSEKYILEVIACYGNGVSLDFLYDFFENEEVDIANLLSNLSGRSLILKKESAIQVEKTMYFLSHDIIMDTVYQQMSQKSKENIHFLIILILLQQDKEKQSIKTIMLIAKQIMNCTQIIQNEKEHDQFIRILYNACIYAKENTMIEESYRYVKFCVSLIELGRSSIKEKEIDNIYIELAECTFINGKVDESTILFENICKKTRCKEELIAIKMKMFTLHTSISGNNMVINLGVELLEYFDFHVKTNNINWQILKEVVRFKLLFTRRRVRNIEGLSRKKDMKVKEVSELLIRMSAVANLTKDDDLFILLLLKVCNYSVRFGITEYALPAFAAGSFLLNSVLGMGEQAHILANKTEELLDESNNDNIHCMSNFILGCFVKHWFESSRRSVDYLLKGIEHGLRSGFLQYSEYSYSAMIEIVYITGLPIDEVRKYIHVITEYDVRMKNDVASDTIDLLEDHLGKLEGIESKQLNIDEVLSKDTMQILTYYYYQLQRNYILEEHDKCYELLKIFEEHQDPFKGYMNEVDAEFYLTLIRIDMHEGMRGLERKRNTKKIRKSMKKFAHWVKLGKENHWGRYRILLAHELELFGRSDDIAELYEEGINFSMSNRHYSVAVVGNLLAAKYFKNSKKIKSWYILEMLNATDAWGAKGLAEIIAKRQGISLPKFRDQERQEFKNNKETIKIEEELKRNDYEDNLHLIQSIENLDMNQSMELILESIVDNSKQSYGAFFVEANGNYFLTHEYRDAKARKISDFVTMEKTNDIALKVLRYVTRTKTEVVIQNRESSGIFEMDEYLSPKHEYSIVCAPLIYEEIFIGIIYIETGKDNVYTPKTLENIRYYSSMLAAKSLVKSNGHTTKCVDELPLTQRELEVFKKIVEGNTNKKVGEILHISVSTVKTHLINIYAKLEIKNRVEAVEKAREYGLVK